MGRARLKIDTKYGKLTPMFYSREKRKYALLCDSGNTTFASADSVESGERVSCGCARLDALKDMIGQKYNSWTVVNFVKFENETSTGKSYSRTDLHCQCECGNFGYVTKQSLITGTSKSCGCKRSEIRKENRKEKSQLSKTQSLVKRFMKNYDFGDHVIKDVIYEGNEVDGYTVIFKLECEYCEGVFDYKMSELVKRHGFVCDHC
jgi:hypothetical protein